MVGKNTRTLSIGPSVYEAEAAERRKRELDELVAANRRRQAAWETEQHDREQRRRQREVDATTAKREQAQRKVEAQQAGQWAWATRRNELRDQVAALRSAIQSAEGTMDTAPLDEAARAAGERQVLERRLKAAETDYASHLRTSPM